MSVRIDVHPYELPLASPLLAGEDRIDRRRGFAVRIRAEGRVGIGEASPLPGWTESYARCRQALGATVGRSSDQVDAITLPAEPAARHAIQGATLDWAARGAELSLASYLSDRGIPTAVPVNATVGNGSVSSSVAAATAAVDRGFSVLKCKVGGRPVSAEAERIVAIRDAIGPDVTLRIDANRTWSAETAAALWPTLAAADVAYVEEPLAEPSADALASLADDGVGVAIDETANDWARSLDAWWPHVDAVVLKPMALGGLDRALDRAIEAARREVLPVISGTVDGVVARMAAVHVAAVLPTVAPAGLATGAFLERDLGPSPATVDGGELAVPTDPGIGTLGPWGRETA